MRHLFFVLTILLSLSAAAQAEFKFDQRVHKFPKTKEGVVLKHVYTFTNTGDEPLVIERIKVACSCTKFTYLKEPVAPGQSSEIVVTFDTKGKIAWQDRILEIYANTRKNPTKIRFKVQVDND